MGWEDLDGGAYRLLLTARAIALDTAYPRQETLRVLVIRGHHCQPVIDILAGTQAESLIPVDPALGEVYPAGSMTTYGRPGPETAPSRPWAKPRPLRGGNDVCVSLKANSWSGSSAMVIGDRAGQGSR